MNWQIAVGIAAPLLVFISALIGYLLQQYNKKRDREAQEKKEADDRVAAVAKEKADREEAARLAAQALEAQKAQEMYENMRSDLVDARSEIRALRGDLDKATADMRKQQQEAQELWSKFAALRRELDAAEDHIADVHRWDDGGRHGDMPQRVIQ